MRGARITILQALGPPIRQPARRRVPLSRRVRPNAPRPGSDASATPFDRLMSATTGSKPADEGDRSGRPQRPSRGISCAGGRPPRPESRARPHAVLADHVDGPSDEAGAAVGKRDRQLLGNVVGDVSRHSKIGEEPHHKGGSSTDPT